MSQTLDRALTILDFVGERPRRIAEIATYLDVHHSTALRLLHTLRKHGFVYELPDHTYRLGSATFRLGFQALESIDIRSVARPWMIELRDKTGETVHFGILENNEVVYVEKVEAMRPLRLHSRIGAIANLHCTGVAKAILAFSPDAERRRLLHDRELVEHTPHTITSMSALEEDLAATRERGFSIDDEENEPGIHCVGAPILDGGSRVVGAISVSAPDSRVDRETLLSFVPALLEATRKTSEQLGWAGS